MSEERRGADGPYDGAVRAPSRARPFRRVLVIVLTVVAMLLVGLGTRLLTWWADYRPPEMTGAFIASEGPRTTMVSDVSDWFGGLTRGQMQIGVAPPYQVSSYAVRSVEQLSENTVQLDVLVHPRFPSFQRISELAGCANLIDAQGVVEQQCVFELEDTADGYRVVHVMTPAEYQIARDPDILRDTSLTPTLPQLDGDDGYWLTLEALQVTYDAGRHWIVVPGGVDRVIGGLTSNTAMWLAPSSYVITPGFTAFVGYEDGQAQLLYSLDAGAHWNTSTIGPGYDARDFVSVTDDRVVVAYASGRTLGADCYVMRGVERARLADDPNGAEWTEIPLYMGYPPDLTLVRWVSDTTAFVGARNRLYVTDDAGAHYTRLTMPAVPGLENSLGYDPYDRPVDAYVDGGTTYVVLGQGKDGDYAPDGALTEAVFAYDATTRSFDYVREQAAPTPQEAR